MDGVLELVEREALRDLKARYFLYLDTKRWDEWLALFTPDAVMRWDLAVGTGGRDARTTVFDGIAAIRAAVVEGTLARATSVHHGHAPVLELVSADEATGVWAMEDIVRGARGALHGCGHYHETYRKVDGSWRISTLHLTRLLLEEVSR